MTLPLDDVPVAGSAGETRTRRRLDLDAGDAPALLNFGPGRGRRIPNVPAEALPASTDVIGLLTDSATPARVADVECGQGMAAINLALAYPHITVVGFASDPADIAAAQDNARSEQVAERIAFELLGGRGTLAADGPFDVVFFFGSVHSTADPRQVLDQARAALSDRGVVVIVSAGAAEEPQPTDDEGGDDGQAPGNVMELDPAEQVQVYFPAARVLWCPPPGLLEPGLGDQRGGVRAPEETRAWLTRRVEVAGDGLASLGTREGPDL